MDDSRQTRIKHHHICHDYTYNIMDVSSQTNEDEIKPRMLWLNV